MAQESPAGLTWTLRERGPGRLPIRTLVVDDARTMLDALCSYLRTLGSFRIVGTAANGVEALEQVEMLQPDLVLMDLQMPEMNGLEATSRVKNAHPETRVIVVTVHDGEEILDACRKNGADAYVCKNRVQRELLDEVRRLFPQSGIGS